MDLWMLYKYNMVNPFVKTILESNYKSFNKFSKSCIKEEGINVKKKVIFSMIIVALLIVLIIIAFFTFPWLGMYTGIKLMPNPPRPEIIYGEFPFSLEYEINGQRIVIQDTLICEYDGIGLNEAQGKYRKWKEHLVSGNQKILLLKVDDSKEIYYDPGNARYYMGDLKSNEGYEHNFPNAMIAEKKGGTISNSIINADELLNKYNIKLISWKYSKPITNNFSTTKK